MGIINLLVFAVLGLIASFGMIRAANFFYTKIGTYHPTSYHDSDESELLRYKVIKLILYNYIVVLSTAGLILLYILSPIGESFSLAPSSWVALLLASLIMNFSIRVGSLADIRAGENEYLFQRSISFGYSFILSIYFLSFFGAGTYIVNNGWEIPAIESPSIGGETVISLLLLIFIGPIVSSIVSEFLLHPRVLDVVEKDEYEL